MPAKACDLQIDYGRSFYPSWIWIGGGQGVNPAGTTAVALFRQVPSDIPLLTVTTTANSNGSVINYLPAVPNYPYIAFGQTTPTLITVYPIQLSIVPADTSLLIYPVAKWKLDVTWPTGVIFPWLAGDVEMLNV